MNYKEAIETLPPDELKAWAENNRLSIIQSFDPHEYRIWIDMIIRPRRESHEFQVDIPYTPLPLVVEICNKIPQIKEQRLDLNIAVLYTIEIAYYLCHLGFTNITMITAEHGDEIQRTTDIYKMKYMVIPLDKEVNVKFDCVLGNPPYQGMNNIPTIGKQTNGKQIYKDFYKMAKMLAPITAIIMSARWDRAFERVVLHDPSVNDITYATHHFPDVNGIEIVYVLRNVSDDLLLLTTAKNGQVDKIPHMDYELSSLILPRCSLTKHTLDKLKPQLEQSMDTILVLYQGKSYGIPTGEISDNGDYPIIKTVGARGKDVVMGYVNEKVNQPDIDNTKVIFGRVGQQFKLGTHKIINPGILISATIQFFKVDDREEGQHLIDYLESSVITFLVKKTKSTLSYGRIFWDTIPLIDLTRSWTDKELYEHFGLTDEEIKLIEDTVK